MAEVPNNPKIFHITHVNNLARIIGAGCIWSDRQRIDRGLNCEVVGMSSIKQRRLTELVVDCHAGTFVGEYVPFYFCPRSIMLYILNRRNHPDVTYRGGQGPIVHLQADLQAVVTWAQQHGRRWAFSTSNAGARWTVFHNSLARLDAINWDAVHATDFRDPVVKDGKQAEFLHFESFPWELIELVGGQNDATVRAAGSMIGAANHRPPVEKKPSWYY
jgi:hypothetical protein